MLKKALCIVIVLMLIVCLTAPCFAVGTAITFGSMWGAAATGYAIGNGFAIDSYHNGVKSSFSNPFSHNDWKDMHHSLYSEYYNSKSSDDITRLGLLSPSNWDLNYNNTDFYDQVELWNNIETQYQNGLFSTVTFDTKTTEQLDDYYNWLLGTKLGISKNAAGVYVLPNSQYDIGIISVETLGTYLLTSTPVCAGFSPNMGKYLWAYSNNSNVYIGAYRSGASFAPYQLLLGSAISTSAYIGFSDSNTIAPVSWDNRNVNSVFNGIYTDYVFNSDRVRDNPLGLYVFNSKNDYAASYNVVGESNELKIETTSGDIAIPDNEDSNYNPLPLPIPWNVPYDSNIDVVVDNAIDLSLAGELADVTEDVIPTPSNVMPPFLPFSLPSLAFNFASIWHYVVEWIGSIRSGASFILSIWNNIPYAMVVPIWATAVIVIVTSIFKRFV